MFRTKMPFSTLSLLTLPPATLSQITALPKEPEAHIDPIQVSSLQSFRNNLLSWFVPVKLATAINDKFVGSATESGVFKQFVDELQNSLNITGSSPEFVAKLIPEYLSETMRDQMATGELLAMKNKIENDLTHAYDESYPEKVRNLYKNRAFKTVMLQLGPHGLKHIQSMRPKDANSWVSDAISTAQSDLPAVPLGQVETMLKDAFKAAGTLQYVDHFSDHFQVVKVLGAGTVGIAALVKFKETPSSKETELVVKIIRPGTVERFIKDSIRLDRAVDILLAQKKITPLEALSFKYLSAKRLAEELREANPNIENAHLLERPYQGAGVTTVRGNFDLAGKAVNVVFMEKAKGIELGKYLKKIRKMLAAHELSEGDRKILLQNIAKVRNRFSIFAQIHLNRIAQNLPVHADPHSGNFFYDPDTDLLSVLDLGAEARPVSKASHLQLRQFLFSIYLSVGTTDTHYLKMFYEHYNSNPAEGINKVDPAKVEQLVSCIQLKLDQIKKKSADQNVIDSDKATGEVMDIISNAALTKGAEIVPNALIGLARSNSLIAEELDELRKDLAGTEFAKAIPYNERTQLGIALKSALNQDRKHNAGLWTEETWDYFKKNALSTKKLQFEKKFIYGVFGLNESEAAMADLAIPAAVVTGPIAVALGARALVRTIKVIAEKLPQIVMSYKFIDTLKNMHGAGVPVKEFFSKLNSTFSAKDFKESLSNRFKSGIFSRMPLKTPALHPVTPVIRPRFFMSPTMRKFVPGLVVGGGLVYGAKKLHDFTHRKPKA